MYCYRTWEIKSGTFSSPGAFMFLWMCFPRCPVHLCRLWVALRSSENELAVGFTVWVLAQWNDSPATRSSAGGNKLPKGSQLEFPAGGTLSHYGAMRLLAEILHCLFQIHSFCSLVAPQMAPLLLLQGAAGKTNLNPIVVQNCNWSPMTPALCNMEWGIPSLLSQHMNVSFTLQFCVFFGLNEVIIYKTQIKFKHPNQHGLRRIGKIRYDWQTSSWQWVLWA